VRPIVTSAADGKLPCLQGAGPRRKPLLPYLRPPRRHAHQGGAQAPGRAAHRAQRRASPRGGEGDQAGRRQDSGAALRDGDNTRAPGLEDQAGIRSSRSAVFGARTRIRGGGRDGARRSRGAQDEGAPARRRFCLPAAPSSARGPEFDRRQGRQEEEGTDAPGRTGNQGWIQEEPDPAGSAGGEEGAHRGEGAGGRRGETCSAGRDARRPGAACRAASRRAPRCRGGSRGAGPAPDARPRRVRSLRSAVFGARTRTRSGTRARARGGGRVQAPAPAAGAAPGAPRRTASPPLPALPAQGRGRLHERPQLLHRLPGEHQRGGGCSSPPTARRRSGTRWRSPSPCRG
jgi:hypothetical protein